jgi:hypothetical protein
LSPSVFPTYSITMVTESPSSTGPVEHCHFKGTVSREENKHTAV